PGHVSSDCPARVHPTVTAQVLPEVAAQVLPEVISQVLPEVTAPVLPEIPAQVLPEITAPVLPVVTAATTAGVGTSLAVSAPVASTSLSSVTTITSAAVTVVSAACGAPVVIEEEVSATPINIGDTTSVGCVDAGAIVVPNSQQPVKSTAIGNKRRRSPGRKLKSPKSKKDCRPGHSSSAVVESGSDSEAFFSSDEHQSDDLSFSSDVFVGFNLLQPEDVPLPEDDFTDSEKTAYPLTQVTPDVPFAQRGMAVINEPEVDSQLSEESRVTNAFFANLDVFDSAATAAPEQIVD
ncbi:Hypothetical predicted protein, partial [Paramuricea clavata]